MPAALSVDKPLVDLRGYDVAHLPSVTLDPDAMPERCLTMGEPFEVGSTDWLTAQYEIRTVASSADKRLKVGDRVIFSRVMPYIRCHALSA